MTVIVCIDDRRGMMFNRRRQSRDREIIADVVKDLDGRLLCDEYSRPLFDGFPLSPVVSNGFLDEAERGDVCFVENRAIAPYLNKTEKIIVYRWNRHYPADLRLDVFPEKAGYRLLETVEFAGYSHEKITKEIYVK